MLLQDGKKVPFDISDFEIIFYKDSIGLEQQIKKSIKKATLLEKGQSRDYTVSVQCSDSLLCNTDNEACILLKLSGKSCRWNG